jgi:outer membrane biosynthesis protein TonB
MRVFTSAGTTSICILLLAATLFGAGQVAAQQPSPDQIAAVKSNCRSDFMAKCWGVPRGGTEAFQCLKKNLASLSAPCQQAARVAIAAATPKAPSAAPAAAKQEGAPAAPTQPSAAAAPPAATPSSSQAPKPDTAAATPHSAPHPEPTPQSPPKAAAKVPEKPAGATHSATTQSPASSAAQEKAKASATAEESNSSAPAKQPAAAPAPETSPTIIGIIAAAQKIDGLSQLGDGRQLRCLESNKASLSPDCQGALAKLDE